MAIPSLIQLTSLRSPTAADRQQLLQAVGQYLELQQQTQLFVQQQAGQQQQSSNRPSAVTSGAKKTVQLMVSGQTSSGKTPSGRAVATKTAGSGRATQPTHGEPHRASQPLVSLHYQVWTLQYGQQATQTLNSPEAVVAFFQQSGVDGRLLILGEPGAGKTQTLLTLGSGLLAKARSEGGPVPVLLDLATWQGGTLAAWCMAQLWEQYRVPENLAQAWLGTAQLTLLLDGFDVLGTSQQRTCLAAIEGFLRGDMNHTIALCCRRQTLERTGLGFSQFNSGVLVMPLVAQQVKDYVMGLEQPELWKRIKGDKVLQQLARFPLLLNFLVESYEGQAAIANRADLVRLYGTHQIQRLAQRSPRAFSPVVTQRYLGWLARQLGQGGRTFYLDSLRPTQLPPGQQWLYRLCLGLILGGVVGLVSRNWILGLAIGLLGSQVDIERFPKYTLSLAALSWKTGLTLLGRSLVPGSILALGLGLVGWLVASPFRWGAVGLTIGAFGGATLGILAGGLLELRSGLQGGIQIRKKPNQDTVNGMRNLICLLVGVGFLIYEGVHLGAIALNQPAHALVSPQGWQTLGALALTIALWASYGLQHVLIRGFLWSNGSIPWNYGAFLRTAAHHRLLQKVGGGYRFIHEDLREHLAQPPTAKSN